MGDASLVLERIKPKLDISGLNKENKGVYFFLKHLSGPES